MINDEDGKMGVYELGHVARTGPRMRVGIVL